MERLVQDIKRSVRENVDFFEELPEKVCSKFANTNFVNEDNCWTGSGVGRCHVTLAATCIIFS